MFTQEHYTVDYNPRSIATQMIRAQGAKNFMGSGAFGRVYGDPRRNLVYKIGDIDANAGYLAYVKAIARHGRENAFLPRIYGVRYIKSKAGRSSEDDVFVVAMEKLSELPKQLTDSADWIADQLRGYNRTEKGMAALGVKISIPRELKEALRVARRAYNSEEHEWDLHHGNFMVRDGRQLVLTDPLV